MSRAVQRGDGVGLEVTTTVVRGVRLAHDEPGRVAAVVDVPVARSDDQAVLLDALVRAHGQLGADGLPTRIGWFPARSTLQRIDVTGRTGPELNLIRHDLSDDARVSSTMLLDADARRWLLALRWDHGQAWRLQELAERAGFVDVTVEPAPVALERVLPDTATVARRDAGERRSWAAVYDHAVPVAAATVETDGREYPGLAVADDPIGLHGLDEIGAETDLDDELGRVASGALAAHHRSSELTAGLRVVGDPYPPFPAHDLRAPQRIAVALGAAVGAAGLSGRLRPVDVTPTRHGADSQPRPWVVERVSELAPPNVAPRPSWRKRLRVWLRQRMPGRTRTAAQSSSKIDGR